LPFLARRQRFFCQSNFILLDRVFTFSTKKDIAERSHKK